MKQQHIWHQLRQGNGNFKHFLLRFCCWFNLSIQRQSQDSDRYIYFKFKGTKLINAGIIHDVSSLLLVFKNRIPLIMSRTHAHIYIMVYSEGRRCHIWIFLIAWETYYSSFPHMFCDVKQDVFVNKYGNIVHKKILQKMRISMKNRKHTNIYKIETLPNYTKSYFTPLLM